MLVIGVAAVVAGVIAAVGPPAIAALPEPAPDDADPDKLPYPRVSTLPGIRWWLVVPAVASAAVVAWQIETPELIPAWVAVCGIGSWLAFVDWHTRYLPFAMVAALYVAVLALVLLASLLAQSAVLLLHAALGSLALYVVYRVMHWIAGRFFGGAFGYGDVRLSAALGLALGGLGSTATVVGGYAGFLLGGVVGPLLALAGVVDRKGFAFGPYMLLGAVVGVVWGGQG